MHEALTTAINAPDVREQYTRAGVDPLTSATPAACRDYLAAEIERWGAIAREAGARAD